MGRKLWTCELYLALHCTSIHVSPSLSVPSLVRTHFIAHYRFPLQCHAPHHTAAATVASTPFSSLVLTLSLNSHMRPHSRECCSFHRQRFTSAVVVVMLFFFSSPLCSGGAPSPRVGLGIDASAAAVAAADLLPNEQYLHSAFVGASLGVTS